MLYIGKSISPTQSHSEASSGIDYSALRSVQYSTFRAVCSHKVIAIGFNTLCYDAREEITLCTNKKGDSAHTKPHEENLRTYVCSHEPSSVRTDIFIVTISISHFKLPDFLRQLFNIRFILLSNLVDFLHCVVYLHRTGCHFVHAVGNNSC